MNERQIVIPHSPRRRETSSERASNFKSRSQKTSRIGNCRYSYPHHQPNNYRTIFNTARPIDGSRRSSLIRSFRMKPDENITWPHHRINVQNGLDKLSEDNEDDCEEEKDPFNEFIEYTDLIELPELRFHVRPPPPPKSPPRLNQKRSPQSPRKRGKADLIETPPLPTPQVPSHQLSLNCAMLGRNCIIDLDKVDFNDCIIDKVFEASEEL